MCGCVKQCQVQHASSCDYAGHCQRFILRNFTPEMFFPNLLTRSSAELGTVGPIDVYAAGFPCKAWAPQATPCLIKVRALRSVLGSGAAALLCVA